MNTRNRRAREDGMPVDKRDVETVRYVVTGFGSFPVDMMRYDRCWPIEGELFPEDMSAKGRRVTMNGLNYPTKARWRSFGWTVVGEIA